MHRCHVWSYQVARGRSTWTRVVWAIFPKLRWFVVLCCCCSGSGSELRRLQNVPTDTPPKISFNCFVRMLNLRNISSMSFDVILKAWVMCMLDILAFSVSEDDSATSSSSSSSSTSKVSMFNTDSGDTARWSFASTMTQFPGVSSRFPYVLRSWETRSFGIQLYIRDEETRRQGHTFLNDFVHTISGTSRRGTPERTTRHRLSFHEATRKHSRQCEYFPM